MYVAPGAAQKLAFEARLSVANAVEILVHDSGPGLPEGAAAVIFEPFHTTKPGGLGMGLAISRTIVELHGGTLGAASGPNGATLRFTLRPWRSRRLGLRPGIDPGELNRLADDLEVEAFLGKQKARR